MSGLIGSVGSKSGVIGGIDERAGQLVGISFCAVSSGTTFANEVTLDSGRNYIGIYKQGNRHNANLEIWAFSCQTDGSVTATGGGAFDEYVASIRNYDAMTMMRVGTNSAKAFVISTYAGGSNVTSIHCEIYDSGSLDIA